MDEPARKLRPHDPGSAPEHPLPADAAALNDRMRADWDARAAEDAYYYVASTTQGATDEEFQQSGQAVGAHILRMASIYLRDLSETDVVEIGCGPARLGCVIAPQVKTWQGVDISPSMAQLAQARLAGVRNAKVWTTDGDLAPIATDSAELVYSYAVFQHIPSRNAVCHYLSETARVLRPGGVLVAQFSGSPPTYSELDTWSGDWMTHKELLAAVSREGFLTHELDGVGTQYMWIACQLPSESPNEPT